MKFVSRIALPLIAPLLVCVGGCHAVRAISEKQCHDPQAYQRAASMPQLKIPAGMDAPDTTNALRLPVLNEPAPPLRTKTEPCLDEPPPFKVQKPAPRPPPA